VFRADVRWEKRSAGQTSRREPDAEGIENKKWWAGDARKDFRRSGFASDVAADEAEDLGFAKSSRHILQGPEGRFLLSAQRKSNWRFRTCLTQASVAVRRPHAADGGKAC